MRGGYTGGQLARALRGASLAADAAVRPSRGRSLGGDLEWEVERHVIR
jgi:hypothetical protein